MTKDGTSALKPYESVIKAFACEPGQARTKRRIEGVPDLWLEVTASGHKAWKFIYRMPGGKPQTLTLGTYPAKPLANAIKDARAHKHAIENEGRDPVAERKAPKGATLGDWYQRWHVVAQQRGMKSLKSLQEGLWTRNVVGIAGLDKVAVADLKRQVIKDALENIAEEGTLIQSDRTQTLISSVCSYIVNEGNGVLEFNPCFRIPRRANETPRTRVLTEDEIRAVWNIPQSPHIQLTFRALLLTGQRRTEVAEAVRSEFEFGAMPAWTIPASRTKNSVAQRLPLPATAVGIFKQAMALGSHERVFASAYGPLDKETLNKAIVELRGAADFTVHDIRRTVGTGMARLKVQKETRERVLNHVAGKNASMTTAVYDAHDYDDEKLEALTRWQGELLRIVGEL